ncbi:LysR family transcriptional regulator [Rhodovibrionaceae bacterium A322]
MDLNTLKLFLAVMEQGSFAAVARQMDLAPSSVSRSIAQLEADLGMRLFQRSTRQMHPTEAGRLYHRRIAPLVEELDLAQDLSRDSSQEASGLLRVTTSTAFGQEWLLALVPAFLDQHPQVSLDLQLTDSPLDLLSEGVDLALRLGRPPQSDLICSKLMDTRYRVVASPDYLAKAPPLQQPADLRDRTCLLFTLANYRSHWHFRLAGKTMEVPVAGRLHISNALSLLRAARQGLGPALLADWLTRTDLETGRLVDLFPGHEVSAGDFETAVWLLYPSRRYLPLKVRLFIDHLRAASQKSFD